MEMQMDPAQTGAQITWQSEEREPEIKMNDHIAWNGTNESKRWFEEKYYEKCTGTASYEWNSYTSVEIDFTTGNCCIEFDQPREIYSGYHHGGYQGYW